MADTLVLINYLYFAAFDSVSHELLYTKYNFNFVKYNADYTQLPVIDVSSEIFIFKDFLTRNGTTYDASYNVLPSLTQYFETITQQEINYLNQYGYCIHPNYSMNITRPTFISPTTLVNQQFDLAPYSIEQILIVQDYFYYINNVLYSKWNFNFNLYSSEFNVYGSKLLIFTDFVTRCIHLSGTVFGISGYGLPNQFIKYFIQNITVPNYNNLSDYIVDNGVTSIISTIYKNVYNIDFTQYYALNPTIDLNLPYVNGSVEQYFYQYGQFELLEVPLFPTRVTPINSFFSAVGTITTSGTLGTGFLYSFGYGDPNIYIITCYHLLQGVNDLSTIKATFEIHDNSNIPTSVTAQFKTIGFDTYSDVYIGIYDPTYAFNISHQVDLTPFTPITLNIPYTLTSLQKISTIANTTYTNNLSVINGTISDPQYTGSFDKSASFGIPDTILINMTIAKGSSGSPIFIGDPLGVQPLTCVGMLNGSFQNETEYSTAISGYILQIIVTTSIRKWNLYSSIYVKSPKTTYFFTRNAFYKRWLGVYYTYFHPLLSTQQFPTLNSLPWVGGLVINEFILGFNYNTEQFITNYEELALQSVFEINTPLLNSKMYSRFLNGSQQPIVLKSATYFDSIRSEYSKFYLGKFSNQVSYGRFMYGVGVVGTQPAPLQYQSTTPVVYQFGDITLEYYYFDGIQWIQDTEIISGNNPSNYNVYTDKVTGLNSYYQHKLEVPITLTSYEKSYAYSPSALVFSGNAGNNQGGKFSSEGGGSSGGSSSGGSSSGGNSGHIIILSENSGNKGKF